MYRLTWRVLYENRALLENEADPDVQTLRSPMGEGRSPRRTQDARVRALPETQTLEGDKRYIAWFEPEHEILQAGNAVLRAALPEHAMDDRDARTARAVWTGTRHRTS